MTERIAITDEELNKPEMIELVTSIPASLLDINSPGISPEVRKKILKDKYKKRVIADGLETGQITLTERGYVFSSYQTSSSFAGFVFEAYLVEQFNSNEKAGLRAFQWCTERSEGWSKKPFLDCKAVGTGLLSTKRKLIGHFSPHSNADIIFIRKNPNVDVMEPVLIHNQNNAASIQVKSIKFNFKEEIVDKVLSGKYRRVITMLSDYNKRPSWSICHNILLKMWRSEYITQAEYANAINRIQGPEYFELSQQDADDYHEYIMEWHRGQVNPTHHIAEAASQEIIGYKYENGL
ncbi:hypothetical protein ACI1AJ_004075, partial [Cronobacter sakazakii]